MGQSLHQSGSSSCSRAISQSEDKIQGQKAYITPAPGLRVRQDACAQASQSASQAIQQASQQASQAVRQASQSASQGIQQAQQSASQSIAAASRTVSSVSSSANSAVSSVQASAESAIFQANLAMQTAQLNASLAQSEASNAVLAAAQNPGPTASAQLGQANPVATPSHAGTVTGTQLALAIVASIIASSLITILAHIVILRHKKLSRAARSQPLGDGPGSVDDLKFPVSAGVTTTIETTQSAYSAGKKDPPPSPHVTFSLSPKSSSSDIQPEKQKAPASNTELAKGPANVPKSPSLRSWLRRQNNVSPFGPIQLPTRHIPEGPLGGQLKSPLRGPPPPRFILDVSLEKKPSADVSPSFVASTSKSKSTSRPLFSPETIDGVSKQASTSQPYRESKASEWTDAISNEGSAMFPSSSTAPGEPFSGTQDNMMQIPSPNKPVRNTAEWLMDRATFRAYSPDLNSRTSKQSDDGRGNLRPNITAGLPINPRGPNLPSRTRLRSDLDGDGGQVSNGLLDPKGKGKASANGGERTQPNTPGVGKAL